MPKAGFLVFKEAFYKKELFIHPFIPTKFQFEKCLGKMHYFKFKEYFVFLVIFHQRSSGKPIDDMLIVYGSGEDPNL